MSRMIRFILIRSTQVLPTISNLIIALVTIIPAIRVILLGRAYLKENQSRVIFLINGESLRNGPSLMIIIHRQPSVMLIMIARLRPLILHPPMQREPGLMAPRGGRLIRRRIIAK
ncbi:MAG: hypothetical protein EBT62_03080 [Opitutaceae bacterium]|nr:hypothetical protein [Opitutaceae bacterium]